MRNGKTGRYVATARRTWGFDFSRTDRVRHIECTVHEVRRRGSREVLASTKDGTAARLVAVTLNALSPCNVRSFLAAVAAPKVAEAVREASRHRPLGPMRQPGEHRFGD